MDIQFNGHACFSVKTSSGTVVIDPYGDSTGLKLPSLKADVVTISRDDSAYNYVKGVSGEPRVFDWPGEYEAQDIHFKRVHSANNTITVIHFKGIRLCHLGPQGEKLTETQLEQIGDVDVLMIPVGGGEVLSAKAAKEVIEQIEPRVVIPMIYDTDGSKLGLDPLSGFLASMGATATEPMDKFTVRRSELPEDNSKVVVLNVNS